MYLTAMLLVRHAIKPGGCGGFGGDTFGVGLLMLLIGYSYVKIIWMWRIAFAVCLGLTLWGLFAPAPPVPSFDGSDKLMHFLAFSAISVTGRFAFPGISWLPLWLLLLAFAFSAEFLQGWFQPSRCVSYWDAVANLAGVLVTWAAMGILAQLKGRYDSA